jgi:threonine aldolase
METVSADAPRGFASDNASGIHPAVLAAIERANGGHQLAYGDDACTAALTEVVGAHFGPRADAYPVWGGTGANVIALQAATRRWQSVICADSAHVHTDECGAAEAVGGIKLLTVPAPDGKLTPALIEEQAFGFDDVHRARPKVVSIAQATELGTCYTPAELRSVCEYAHSLGLLVHADGARLSNAAVALGVGFRALTTDVGVDVLSFGGTKNGLLAGEAVVVLDPQAVCGVDYLRKSSMQLASKMRFVSAQLHALLAGDLWWRNAAHANAMAARLAERVRAVPGVSLTREPEVNAVFATLAPEVTERLQKRFSFYTWDHRSGEVRWMTSFDTTEADVDAFAAAIAEECESAGGGHQPR